eukprot:m.229334 g.229334  ORF g.229334 m.229334 type:complete len:96 (+) comp13882_c0_seq10:1210-1497(+)
MDCEAGELSSWTKEEGASNRQEHCPDVNCRNCFLSANGCEEFCIKTGMSDLSAFSFVEVLNLIAAVVGVIAVKKRYQQLQRRFELKLERRVFNTV